MFMATYNDYFNVNNKIKSPINNNEDSKNLKSQILKSVKHVIEDDKSKRTFIRKNE